MVREPEDEIADIIPVPILGTVAAGQPLFAEENIIGEVLGEGMVASRGRCFALEVDGDSMIKAGIHEGAIVIVRQQPVAESGNIVVALLGDEATVKYEEVYLKDYADRREARGGLRAYFRFYNEQRPHQALDYRTLAQVYYRRVEDERERPGAAGRTVGGTPVALRAPSLTATVGL